ncbi:hypothetical protein IFM89_010114 [Coptis chinensis]|uniref:Uncharacterized protein n=1 Tax=Coptis chinensis TaxID=261450 RepID=A0A835I150_9MAGN|nr:hypothetical protein IFM89_010114 [Coptis chinensis]
MSLVGRKKDFECVERIKGRPVNVLQGLELHTRVFSDEEQKKIVDYVYDLQRMGHSGELREQGEFSGAAKIPLPVGSVLILKGNGADVAKHYVPAVHKKGISITFRKMDDRTLPFKFSPDPELQRIQPLGSSQMNKLPAQQVPSLQNSQTQNRLSNNAAPDTARKTSSNPIQFGKG